MYFVQKFTIYVNVNALLRPREPGAGGESITKRQTPNIPSRHQHVKVQNRLYKEKI